MRVPYNISGDLNRDPSLDNYPQVACTGPGLCSDVISIGCRKGGLYGDN